MAGCAGTLVLYQPMAPPPRPMQPQPWRRVEFRTTVPERPYPSVGLLQAQPESDSGSEAPRTMMVKLLERAGQVGCDGVIWLGKTDVFLSTDPSLTRPGQSLVLTSGGDEKVQGYRASCFLYNEAPPGAEMPFIDD
jgi:hypothetical protein